MPAVAVKGSGRSCFVDHWGHGMALLSIAKGVYFVTGAVGAILYDAKNGYIYHLDLQAKEVVLSILSCGHVKRESYIDAEFIKVLLSKGLLTDSDSDWKGDIRTLSQKQTISFAWIEVTTDCNLKCIHCYEGEALRSKTHMSRSTFERIIDELCACGVKKIQLIGGEPLTSPTLRSFLDYALGKFGFIEVYTNGTLIDEGWVDYFARNGVRVALSVYSYDSQNHDKATGCIGSCVKTNRSIKMLADAGVKYRVRNVLLKGVCLGEKNTDLYTLSSKKDVVRMVGRANARLLSAENIMKRLITKESFSAPIPVRHVARMVSGHNCFSTHLYFSVDGTIYPCVMERRLSHGNINDGNLHKLLNPEILCFGKDKITECRNCEFRYFCFDCRPDSFGACVSEKPWYCTYHPLMGEWDNPESFVEAFQRKFRA